MENKKLTRSNNRMLAGVCAGLADYFGWDVTVVRIIYSFATVFMGHRTKRILRIERKEYQTY